MSEKSNILDILMDEDNRDPIILTSKKNGPVAFEQVAVIPRDNTVYCILKPIDKLADVADDEAIVFRVVDDDEYEPYLMLETDEKISGEVFLEYYDLLEEAFDKEE